MKKIFMLFCCFMAILLMVSCGGSSSSDNNLVSNFGKLGKECYPNKTCDSGLICDDESNTCIEDSNNPINDSDISSEEPDDNADTSSEQNDDQIDTASLNDDDSGDSVNENPDNLPECSPTSSTPCIDSNNGFAWSGKSAEKIPWIDAVDYCKNLNEGGYNDWQLPRHAALKTLVQECESSGYSDGKCSKFGDVVFFWSSNRGLGVFFYDGETQSKSVDKSFDARCVRKWNLQCDEKFFDPTLKCDLTWSAKAQYTMKWQSAVEYCENLSEDGYDDWHLPTISELRTLIQNCHTETGGTCGVTDSCLSGNGCIRDCDSCYDENNPDEYSKLGDKGRFWSSSTDIGEAWFVNFSDGHVGSILTSSSEDYLSARCVR